MNKDKQRKVIAKEHTGIDWVFLQCWCQNKDGKLIAHPRGPLDYPNCLNACHEMEKVLTDTKHILFRGILLYLTKSTNSFDTREYISSTPSQRSEAFIKTVCPEKWEDE